MGASTFVTIYTDASYCAEQNVWTWAFYAKSQWGVLVKAGKAQRKLRSSNEAEMYSICTAIWMTLRKWPSLSGFFVNTDSLSCCHCWWTFSRFSGQGSPDQKKMKKKCLGMIKGRWIRVKHVKAHQKPRDVRSYLNNKVDALAREARKK